jgi:hypothetical protein
LRGLDRTRQETAAQVSAMAALEMRMKLVAEQEDRMTGDHAAQRAAYAACLQHQGHRHGLGGPMKNAAMKRREYLLKKARANTLTLIGGVSTFGCAGMWVLALIGTATTIALSKD